MYAPKYRYQKSTPSFHTERGRGLSQSRSKLRHAGGKGSASSGLGRRNSSTGSLPLALAQASTGPFSAFAQRLRRSPRQSRKDRDSFAAVAGESVDITDASIHTAVGNHRRRQFNRRSISAPATPMHGDEDDHDDVYSRAPYKLLTAQLAARQDSQPAWWESPPSTFDEGLSDKSQGTSWSTYSHAQSAAGDLSSLCSSAHGAGTPVEDDRDDHRHQFVESGDSHRSHHSRLSQHSHQLPSKQSSNPFTFLPAITVQAISDRESPASPHWPKTMSHGTSALGAEMTDEELANIAARQAGGRRRSVTFKLDSQQSSSGQQQQQRRERPSFLSFSRETSTVQLPDQTAPANPNFLLVERHGSDERRGSVSSRSSNASSIYGAPPAPYEFDHQRYSRRNSAEDQTDTDSNASAPSIAAQDLRKKFAANRRKSIDGNFQWNMAAEFDFKPSSVECVNLSFRIREQRSTFETVKDRCKALLSSAKEQAEEPEMEEAALLRKVNLKIDSGSLVGILGPSGCGKTTLLNTIAKRYSRKEARVSGAVLFNGVRSTWDWVRHNVGYVMQNDSLLPALTVLETLVYAARLRVPTTLSDEKLSIRVSAILAELGIDHLADQQIGDGGYSIRGLSGGERRRVSIAVQILSAPPILLLDEPTTGLDSFTASQLVYTLTKLTQQQHVIIMSIHQPRSDLFKLFHDIIIMNSGELVWAGPSEKMLDYFDDIGFSCPLDVNPLQHMVKLASVNDTSREQAETTSTCVASLKDSYSQSNHYSEVLGELKELKTDRVSRKSLAQFTLVSSKGPSPLSKLRVLTSRAFVNTVRSRSAVFARAFQLPVLALYLFLFFTRLGSDQRSLQDRNGLRLETLVEICLSTAVTAMNLCPPMRDQYRLESKEGLYGSFLFLLSYFIHSLPFAALSSLLWTLVVYVLIGQSLVITRMLVYFAVVLLLHLLGEAMAVLMLGLFESVSIADSVTTFWIMTSVALASGTYRVGSSLPQWLYGLSLLTPIGYGGSILKENELAGFNLSGSANCSWSSARLSTNSLGENCYRSGDDFLNANLKDWQRNLAANFGAFIGILMFMYIVICTTFGIRRRLNHA